MERSREGPFSLWRQVVGAENREEARAFGRVPVQGTSVCTNLCRSGDVIRERGGAVVMTRM